MVELTTGLLDRGFATTLITGDLGPGEGDMSYLAAERGLEIEVVPGMDPTLHPLKDLLVIARLVRRFRRDRPLIVHTHTAKAGAVGRIAAALAGVPIRLHTYHGHVLGGAYFPPLLTRVFTGVERALARLTNRIVVVSPSQRDELSAMLALPPDELRVVPLGFDLAPFLSVDPSRERERARSSLGLDPHLRYVGVVGRLAPVKNHELMLEAFARLRSDPSGSDTRLLVVGGGPSERERALRARAEALGIGSAVQWAGWVKHTEEVYPALDVLALTSHDEGTPVAVIEAVASGIPVVARAVGGVGDVLGPPVPGCLVTEDTPEAFASALSRTLAAPPGPTQLAQGRRSITERFGRERLLDDLADLYREELRRLGR